MGLVNEGWEVGPTGKRDFKGPAKIKKDHILITIFAMLYFVIFICRELAGAFWSFLWRLILRPEPKSLKGRVCLVTGAGRGLGRELCLTLAREGAILACVDINEPNNKTTAAMVEELGAKAMPYTVNIAIKKDVENLVSQVEKDLGPVYLLINNAAIVGSTLGIQEECMRASFNVNVFGSSWMMNAVLPRMKSRNEGHIVNILSISTKMIFSPLMIYGATKTSLEYISNCLRSDLQLTNKNNKIVITNVHPSLINTSEDYMQCLSLKINIVLETRHVVKATMNAIRYNYDEVVVPSIMKYPLLLITEMMPSKTGTKLLQLIFKKYTIPTPDQYKHLPWFDLLKECSFMETQEEI